MPMYDEGTNSGFNLLWKDIHILEVENRYTLMAYVQFAYKGYEKGKIL